MPGFLTIAGYLLAAGLLAAGLFKDVRRLRLAGAAAGCAAALLHGIHLASTLTVPGGYDLNIFNSLSLVSWLTVVFILLSALRWQLLEVGVLAFPGAALWVVLQIALDPTPVVLSQAPPIIEAHVAASLVAYAILAIAALNALAIAMQDYILRRHRATGLLSILPPLTTMESLLFQLILAGWVVLTLSLATGFVFLDENLLARHLAHKTILSVASWVVFGLLLFGRWRFGWRGRTAVAMTLSGMFILVLAYFGSKLVLEVILDRTWLQSTGTALQHTFRPAE